MPALSYDGVFVYGAGRQDPGGAPGSATGWTCVATPRAPLVRGLAVTRTAIEEPARRPDHTALRDEAAIVWSDGDGIRSATIVRTRRHRLLAATTEARQQRLLIAAADGSAPRFPLAALDSGNDTLDVLWSPDGRALMHSAHRPAPPAREPEALATPGGSDPVRMRQLDVLATDPRTAWLACLTDASELFAAGWDLAFGRLGRWARLPDPFRVSTSAPAVSAAALVRIAAAPVLLAADRTGRLAAADLRTAVKGRCTWRSVALPAGTRPAPTRALAAGDRSGRAWLAAATDAGLWLARLGGGPGALACGPATLVPVGPTAPPIRDRRPHGTA